MLREVDKNNEFKGTYDWPILDETLLAVRSRLENNVFWPFGARKVLDQLTLLEPGLRRVSIRGLNVFEFGSGKFAPHLHSTYFYINGAASCRSLDPQPIDSNGNAARALTNLLVEAISGPETWHAGAVDREEYLRRIARFDLAALAAQDPERALRDVPITHMINDAGGLPCDGSIDFMFSFSVLEHIYDLPIVIEAFRKSVSDSGILCHTIDFTDHWFHNGTCPHRWGYLTENGGDGMGVNQLRLSEMLTLFRDAGFEIVEVKGFREPLPPAVEQQLLPRFAALSREDRETYMAVVVARPARQ
jgi:hypothetical protein